MKLQVVIHEAEEGGYWAEVPTIPGCASQGDTFEELLQNLHEAVEGCLSVSAEPPKVTASHGNRGMKAVSGQDLCLSSAEPLFEGALALAGRLAKENVFNADVFIEIRPVNALSPGNQAPVIALLGSRMQQPRIPCDRGRDRSPIV